MYADDVAVLGHSEEVLALNTHILLNSAKGIGLKVNTNKIKYMRGLNGNNHLTEEGDFEKVNEFKSSIWEN